MVAQKVGGLELVDVQGKWYGRLSASRNPSARNQPRRRRLAQAGGEMNGDDIMYENTSLPWFPEKMPFWQRVLCLLGYHKWETRYSAKGHRYGIETKEGKQKGVFGLHDETPMKLRDQCGRCWTLR